MNVAVIGLGKLGLCTAACFALKGFKVWGYDANPGIMEALRSGRTPIEETGLEETLARAGKNLIWANDVAQAVSESAVTFIIVPTPSRADGRFDNTYVEAVLKEVGPALKTKHDFHVVDVVSTVMPGSSESVFKPLLEDLSGKVCGCDFSLVYNPEFIALGSVIKDFLNTDLVLIGASDQVGAEVVKEVYRKTCDSNPSMAIMSLVNAEIAKLSLNCYVTMKISFVNDLAALCEKVPGANVDEVTRALGADSRIGPKYLKGGLGFGGPCFPRDNLALLAFAQEAGWPLHLSPRVVEVNRSVLARLKNIVENQAPEGRTAAVLGLSYKPGTHIVERSQAVELAAALADQGWQVRVHDPQALADARKALGEKVSYAADPYQAVEGAAAIILMTDWAQYRDLDWNRAADLAQPGALLLDTWRIVDGRDADRFNHVRIGVGEVALPAQSGLAWNERGWLVGSLSGPELSWRAGH